MREAAMFSDADLQIWRKSQDGKTYDEDHLTARIPLQPESMLGISTSFQVLILDVVKNGAADLAGVRAGEFIDKVDGQSVTDMRSIFQLDQRIKAAADQQHEVLLTLARWSPIENPGAYKTTYETREILVKLTK